MPLDYYKILGVLDDAEDIVIKAAYRALSQRYHPDKWSGNKKDAEEKMRELNEAYSVLSDPLKRREYDSKRNKNEYSEDKLDNVDNLFSSLDEDWGIAIQYNKQIVYLYNNLYKLSAPLAITFKLILLESKSFDGASNLAVRLEGDYLLRYFGGNLEIQKFAKELIGSGMKDAAKELNKVIGVLGSGIDSNNVIKKLTAKFGISYNKSIAAKQKYGVWVRLLSILSRKKALENVSHEDSNTKSHTYLNSDSGLHNNDNSSVPWFVLKSDSDSDADNGMIFFYILLFLFSLFILSLLLSLH